MSTSFLSMITTKFDSRKSVTMDAWSKEHIEVGSALGIMLVSRSEHIYFRT